MSDREEDNTHAPLNSTEAISLDCWADGGKGANYQDVPDLVTDIKQELLYEDPDKLKIKDEFIQRSEEQCSTIKLVPVLDPVKMETIEKEEVDEGSMTEEEVEMKNSDANDAMKMEEFSEGITDGSSLIKSEEVDIKSEADRRPPNNVGKEQDTHGEVQKSDLKTATSRLKTGKDGVLRCSECDYQTQLRRNLRRHLIRHQPITALNIHQCPECSYQTRWIGSLKRHALCHKDDDEVVMHRCFKCNYETKRKDHLNEHVRHLHTNTIRVATYKCNQCDFQAKRKSNLNEHVLHRHTSANHVALRICLECNYQTKRKSDFKRHVFSHKEGVFKMYYHCPECTFQTRFNSALQKHIDRHKQPEIL